MAGPASNTWTVRFEGTEVALRGMTGPVEAAIDGGAARTLTPDPEGGAVSLASGLPDGEHTLVLRSPNGAPAVFLVGRAQPLAWLWVLAPALLLLALAVVGALISLRVAGWRVTS
ncbi:hypothetical protein SE17_27895 [Kouleothrix aurantiaca]|uniref:Uncharacterized protein n=1 Tax=Kouleothrix aurantiaca TaxID=186479 RepID=A0A0P9DCN3_9CHLR|nr:hypothetical protein SE17_27895 [Kouleothrix aurantiaca]